MGVDYHAKFCETVYHLVCEECARRGWDAITEDELEYFVNGLYATYYYQTISELHAQTRQGREPPAVREVPLIARLMGD